MADNQNCQKNMQYKKSQMIVGKWVNKKELGNCKKAKIISETLPQPSHFLNKDGSPKTQDVCRVQFEGKDQRIG